MEFVAVDVETANADMSSICQIGLARSDGKTLTDTWTSYIDPEDDFDPTNSAIHGIDAETVRGAPTMPRVHAELSSRLEQVVVVSHTHFDRVALHRSAAKYGLEIPDSTWLDSACVARRAWPQFAQRGYGLQSISAHIGHAYTPHDALEDAKASAHVLLAAISQMGLDVSAWLERVRLPIAGTGDGRSAVARSGSPDGYLFGEVVVFTGTLSIPRSEAADTAASMGCQVANTVTKATTLLVVGDQDVRRLTGHEKSSKHRKAEALILAGQTIQILSESDFAELARTAPQSE